MKAMLPMLRLACLLAMASAALAAAPPKPAPKAATAPPAKPAPLTPTHLTKWDDFLILTDRNVFDRNRRPPVVRTPRSEAPRTPYTAPQPPKPIDTDQYVVLLGIGLEGPEYTAFFEDSKAGKILQINPGGVVGKGRLRAVNLDSVQYERGGKFSIVKVGCTLTGVQAASMGFTAPAPSPTPAAAPAPAAPTPTAAPTTAPATTQPTTAPSAGETPAPAPAPDGLQDILERMRLRRQQELGR
jgi:hypothetical protein